MIKIIFFVSLGFSNIHFNTWLENHDEIIKSDNIFITFDVILDSKLINSLSGNSLKCSINFWDNDNFRIEIGPRIIISNGKVWHLYDVRTNQIFIQNPDKQINRLLLNWFKGNRIKKLPIKQKINIKYVLIFPNFKYKIKLFFDEYKYDLDSLFIINNGLKTIITNINWSTNQTLDLEIGNDKSEVFDLR